MEGAIGEKTPLLQDKEWADGGSGSKSGKTCQKRTRSLSLTPEVGLRKHIGLATACAVIISGVTGSGIFISPTGVTQSVGSVGLTLIMWGFGGLFNLLLALCYSELGTAFPMAGGEYTYIMRVLGPLPAFLALWISVVLLAPGATAAMAKTAAIHITQMLGHQCRDDITILITVWILVTFAVINLVTIKWAARLVNFFTVIKFIAMGTIVVIGAVRAIQGYTEQYDDVFAGSVVTPAAIIGGFLPSHVSYAGWDMINVLGEEMKNPGRDMPLSTVISLTVVTLVYVLVNMAYFTALSPAQFAQSNAVAQLFADTTIPGAAWVIPIFVALAATGSVNGMTLVYPRYSFAGALDGQLPAVLSHLHVDSLSPAPAIILHCFLSVVIASVTILDIQALLALLGVVLILKSAMALIALIHLKRTMPHIERTVKVPLLLAVFCVILLAGVVGISLYQAPAVNGAGLLIFLLGVPIYYLGRLALRGSQLQCFDKVTSWIQRVLRCLPPEKSD